MAKKNIYFNELKQLKEYIKSDSNEDAKRPLLYPLFKKLYKDKFKIESDANNADIYIEGTLIVEAKSDYSDWLAGFYQALHYQKKFGLAYSTIIIIAHKFIGIWKVNKIPEFAVIQAHTSDANVAPNKIGKLNVRKTTKQSKKEIQNSAIYWLEPKNLDLNFFTEKEKGAKSLEYEIHEIFNVLKNIDTDRIQINTHNFIHSIEYFKKFFVNPIDAVHCFYSIVAYWDITSTIATNEYTDTFQVVGFKGQRLSEPVAINPNHFNYLKKYIETHYVFTNEGSGLTADYYFGRFDEALAAIDPEYVKHHGIFFTDDNLSKFALRFVNKNLPEKIADDYFVFDPAGGSGNLISSWKGKLKHKIISELQPDLLRTIERRMRIDPFHVETGFTVIPKTSLNEGLNFIDISAEKYIKIIEEELKDKNLQIDKPIAFLLNPPYKNTDENETELGKSDANYGIHSSILELTGKDAGKERYLAFLGQILNMSEHLNKKNNEHQAIVLIFTPTSWLIPRPTYINFRKKWDKHFEYKDGFIVTSNEFFKLKGKWPLAFTMWKYNYDENRENKIKIYDYTDLTKSDLKIDWNIENKELDFILNTIIEDKKYIKYDNSRGDIREGLPKVIRNKNEIKQPRYNMYRNLKEEEKGQKYVSGFPAKDERHQKYSVPYGFIDGSFVGFMDNNTPVRLYQDTCNRMTNNSNNVWFMLMTSFSRINASQIHSKAANSRSFCAYDLLSSKIVFSWYAISKVFIGNYPLWANQYDIWQPKIKKEFATYYYSLCYSFALAENRCVVTKFEADNPVKDAPEVFVDNPLCPTNKDAFWATTLDAEVKKEHGVAHELVKKIKELYKTWNLNYCKGQFLYNVGLKDEPYFKYFAYDDFLTPHSGLIQIKKHAEIENLPDILDLFDEIKELTKKVKEEIYNLLVNEFRYFE